MTRLGLIWAEARGRVIGRDGGMPWHVPEDLAHFRAKTTGAPVIMGRRTWDSFPERFRPLPGRRNIVVTRNGAWEADGAERASSLDTALALVASAPDAWVIGGAGLFAEAIERADVLEVTELDLEIADGDTFAPDRSGWAVAGVEPADGWAVSRSGVPYRFLTLIRG
ncbi:MAG: dihydrofolate reductase [Microbacterium sp. SCN 70-200]|uniref:dihydrofolate reductase n=1 Tax=unclassified Microbacterium TaxID=2609290 RepID=UPI00086C47A4|nr:MULTISPECIES: dihydrofolate reductase [unclassified Microbacterium]MBN9214045.1 dihydrofolate reductase [Microbacterium sp.]ODT39758.1 MAG: dihydrofolate reductase [Microbacterium sp. SCN 70-200]OJV82835.1 MAG: dihydrofolate reductase [Microbacterium sp. 70-16]